MVKGLGGGSKTCIFSPDQEPCPIDEDKEDKPIRKGWRDKIIKRKQNAILGENDD